MASECRLVDHLAELLVLALRGVEHVALAMGLTLGGGEERRDEHDVAEMGASELEAPSEAAEVEI